MQTRVATSLAKGTVAECAETLIREVNRQLQRERPALVMAFASTHQPLEALQWSLREAWPGAVVLGASTAGEFNERGDEKGSVSVFAVSGDYVVRAGMGQNLRDDVEGAVRMALEPLPKEIEGHPHRTAVMLVDPLAGNGEEATLLASALLGPDVQLAGGAAGDDLAMKKTLVGCNQYVASNAVVVAMIYSKQKLGVGIGHGHRPISRTVKVTRAEGNLVHELDGKPAWRVWADLSREAARAEGLDPDRLSEADVGAYLLRFEAGLPIEGGIKVRAPLSRHPDGSISFAAGIPTGADLQITATRPDEQVASAARAAEEARLRLGGAEVAGALVFDCICRNLILGTQFKNAVRSISSSLGDAPIAGFETYGEIALSAGDMSGFHNTTTVVLTFPKGGH